MNYRFSTFLAVLIGISSFSALALPTWKDYADQERKSGKTPNQYLYVKSISVSFDKASEDEKKLSLEGIMRLLVAAGTKNPDPDIKKHREAFGNNKVLEEYMKDIHYPKKDYFHEKEHEVLKFLAKGAYLWEKDNEWAKGKKTQAWENILNHIVQIWEEEAKNDPKIRERDKRFANNIMDPVFQHFGIILQAMTANRFKNSEDVQQGIYNFCHFAHIQGLKTKSYEDFKDDYQQAKGSILSNDQLPFFAILDTVRPEIVKLENNKKKPT